MDWTVCPLGTAAEAGSALRKACEKKVNGAAEACREQGIVFLPLAVETLGGLHKTAVQQMKRLAAALARHTGQADTPARTSQSPPPTCSRGTPST